MKHNDWGFATKVWLTGVLIPAVFWGLAGGFLVLALAIFYSAVFSIPSCLLLGLGVIWINRQTWNVGIKKAACCILSVPLTVGAFLLLNVTFGNHLFNNLWGGPALMLGYAASICIGIAYFDLEQRNALLSDEPIDQMADH